MVMQVRYVGSTLHSVSAISFICVSTLRLDSKRLKEQVVCHRKSKVLDVTNMSVCLWNY